MIELDGSMGEGGGQILRSALSLALITGQPFLLQKIRQQRAKPGLQRQHLTAVNAAAEIGSARVEGSELGSTRLAFRPGKIRGGSYRFTISTAGSTMLVLQTVLPALLCAEEPSTVELRGGTHNPMAPTADFLQRAFAPLLARMGAPFELELAVHGFYPAGGGVAFARIEPAQWRSLELLERPRAPRAAHARIVSANLSPHVAEREATLVRSRLGLDARAVRTENVASPGPGNAILIELDLGASRELVCALGEKGLPAEEVATNAVDETLRLLAARVPVGEHLADQLLLPLALAGGGAFRTLPPTEHTRTNAQVIERFLPVHFELAEDRSEPGTWVIRLHRR